MRYYLSFLVIFIAAQHSHARQKSDSIDELYLKAEQLINSNSDSAEFVSMALLSASLKETDYLMAGKAAYFVGYSYDIDNKLLNAGMRYYEALQYLSAAQDKDQELEAKVLISLGRITNLVGKTREAISLYHKAIDITKVDKTRAIIFFNIGYAYYSLKEYDNALLKLFEAYEIFNDQENYSMAAYCLNYIGLCHHYTGDFQAARGYFTRILDTESYLKTDFNLYAGWAQHNIANTYFEDGQLDLALPSYYLALSIKKDNPDSSEQFTTLMDIGELMLKSDKYDSAITYLEKAASLYENKAHNPETFKVFDFLEQAYSTLGSEKHRMYLDRMKQEYNDYIVSIQELQTQNQGYELDLLEQQVIDRFQHHQQVKYWKSALIWLVPLISVLVGLLVYLIHRALIRMRNKETLRMLSEL